MAAVLKRGLEEDGHQVDVATTGPDALRRATEFAYDAVLLDVMLPGMSGVEVCRRLQSQRIRTPIIMISACDSLADRARGLEAGAADYLVKPVSFSVLASRMHAATQGVKERSIS